MQGLAVSGARAQGESGCIILSVLAGCGRAVARVERVKRRDRKKKKTVGVMVSREMEKIGYIQLMKRQSMVSFARKSKYENAVARSILSVIGRVAPFCVLLVRG